MKDCDNRVMTPREMVVSPYKHSARTLVRFYRLDRPLIVTEAESLGGVRLKDWRIWWDHPDLIDLEIMERLNFLAMFEGKPLSAFDALATFA